ncbi:ABC transporter substrate-binding protein [Carnobacterium sp. TMP28]|uniref:ABC transporter substrate-binding protein n=1 Tax=Carnobacterium sp. TMP28 TaxID=3397060 RepID=UPI0039E14BD2
MTFNKKFYSFAAAILSIGLLVSGCGDDTKDEAAGSGSTDEKVQLELWLTPQWKGVQDASEDGADYDSFFKKAAEDYTKENPNVEIDVQVIPGEERADKLSVAMQTKTLPDMFFDSAFALTEYAHAGILAPMDDIIDDESKKDIPETIWDNVQINDETYFYPFSHNPGTLAYNAEMFEKAGLDEYISGEYEIATWTPEEYEMILETLKEKLPDVSPMGLFAKNNQGDTWNLSYLTMFGNKIYDKDGQIVVNEENGVKALEYIKNLNDKELTTAGAETLSSNDVNAMFQNQQVAVSFTNSVLFNGILNDMENGIVNKFDLRLANIPGEKNPTSFTYVAGGAVFNTGTEAEVEASKDFVKYFSTDKELVKASKNSLPVRESVSKEASSELPYLEAYNKNSEYIFNFSNNTPGYAELRNAFFPELQAVFTDEKTPQEALDSFAENGNRIIDTNTEKSVILK